MGSSSERTVFFVSDRTGITVETLGHALLTQFDGLRVRQVLLPFVDTQEKARGVAERIARAVREEAFKPLVFCTLIAPEVRRIVESTDAVYFDFFDTFIDPLEAELGLHSSHTVGRSHGMVDLEGYAVRMDAVNFALAHDDGVSTRAYDQADVVIVGVSRSGKTPTCLYMAMQYGIRAANYPFTEDDLEDARLPRALAPYRDKLYGLTIDPQRLAQIRQERRPGSRYASLAQCRYEVRQAETLYRRERIPHLSTTSQSIEELATAIRHQAGLTSRVKPGAAVYQR
jgi:regulator of PEP synthase PpsR (kinase-PPPase family)